MRRLLFAILAAASLQVLCADDPHVAMRAGVDVKHLDEVVAELERIRRVTADASFASNVCETIARLQQIRNAGLNVAPDGDPLEDYRAFIHSPAYGFLNASERRDLKKLVSYASRRGFRHDGGADPEMAALASRLANAERTAGNKRWCKAPPCDLRPGDLVLRTEAAFLSRCFVEASSREKRFSHVGVVSVSGTPPMIVSIGEGGMGAGRVRVVSWQDYMRNAKDCAVYRFDGGGDVGIRIAQSAASRVGTPFDPAFDLKSKDRLYCSELVRDAVNEAVGRSVIGTTRKDGFEYVSIDDCYRSGWKKIFDANDSE